MKIKVITIILTGTIFLGCRTQTENNSTTDQTKKYSYEDSVMRKIDFGIYFICNDTSEFRIGSDVKGLFLQRKNVEADVGWEEKNYFALIGVRNPDPRIADDTISETWNLENWGWELVLEYGGYYNPEVTSPIRTYFNWHISESEPRLIPTQPILRDLPPLPMCTYHFEPENS